MTPPLAAIRCGDNSMQKVAIDERIKILDSSGMARNVRIDTALLDKLLKDRGWSRTELSRQTGIAESTIRATFTREGRSSLNTAGGIANALGVDVSVLTGSSSLPLHPEVMARVLWYLASSGAKAHDEDDSLPPLQEWSSDEIPAHWLEKARMLIIVIQQTLAGKTSDDILSFLEHAEMIDSIRAAEGA